MDENSLSHTKWRCKYHVVFAPKYRRETELCVDHVHMMIEIPPKYSISEIMGYLREKVTNNIWSSCKSKI